MPSGSGPDAVARFGQGVDFGRAGQDYGRHRAGFPESFFEALNARGWAAPGRTALDLGTGTGTVARGLARMGLRVEALDPSSALLAEAKELDRATGVAVDYRAGRAEAPGGADDRLDLITAGQCWHWFDRPKAAAEALRCLRPGGRIVIAHFDWLPLPANVVAATEALISKHNPDWALGGGSGLYPEWFADLSQAGFDTLESFSYDHDQPYSHEGWRGRVRASAGIKASLSESEVERFDHELAAMLRADFPSDPLIVPHRVWAVAGIKPGHVG
jgi:SAM-dependent methyltransferase